MLEVEEVEDVARAPVICGSKFCRIPTSACISDVASLHAPQNYVAGLASASVTGPEHRTLSAFNVHADRLGGRRNDVRPQKENLIASIEDSVMQLKSATLTSESSKTAFVKLIVGPGGDHMRFSLL